MIFYIALDENGHRQLRGTQADARAVNKNFEQVDIPTDKAGLMDYVQKLFTQLDSQTGLAGESLSPTESEALGSRPELSDPGAPEPDQPTVLEPETPAASEAPVHFNFNPQLLQEQVEAFGSAGEDGFEQFDAYQQDYGVGAGFSRGVHMLTAIAAGEHQLCRTLFRARARRKWG